MDFAITLSRYVDLHGDSRVDPQKFSINNRADVFYYNKVSNCLLSLVDASHKLKFMCLSAYWQWKLTNERENISAVIVKYSLAQSGNTEMPVIVEYIPIAKKINSWDHILKTDRDKTRYFINANQNYFTEDAWKQATNYLLSVVPSCGRLLLKSQEYSLHFLMPRNHFLPFLSPSASPCSPFGKSGQLSNSSRTPSPSLRTAKRSVTQTLLHCTVLNIKNVDYWVRAMGNQVGSGASLVWFHVVFLRRIFARISINE